MNKRINQRQFGRRRGFSLIEMMVVVTLSALVLGTVVSLMVGLRRWDRRFHGRAVESSRLVELADLLRADIRRATDVRADAEGQLVIESSSGDPTRYELGPQGCTRTVATAGAAGRRIELFAIGPTTQWNVDRDVAGRRPLVRITLDRADTKVQAQTPRRVPLLVYAALGADLVPGRAGSSSTPAGAEDRPARIPTDTPLLEVIE